ncbi:hypothetical protein D9611_014077 [Ephemerocybe angulata]|uniref:2OGFeDO JBP1/TET oxygenase domain-containing protein n=1 Tax=Ephemerocybe angulata TaxID=980116 RepID=A0A8H5BAZ1_9AGAR|nr:hypothetical protein D9611_014077 [Tulosesus angulatus]
MPTTEYKPSTGLRLCATVGRFMQDLFHYKLAARNPYLLPIPALLDRELVEDCYLAVETIFDAAKGRNEYSTSWTLAEYRAGERKGKDGKTTKEFPRAKSHRYQEQPILIDSPCHVSDSDGKVVAWYLPGAISSRRQAQVEKAIVELSDAMEKPLPIVQDVKSTWRTNSFFFRDPEECAVRPGCVCFSPCWYSQAHPPPNHEPGPSQTLASDTNSEEFIRSLQEYNALVGGMLAVIHPDLYRVALGTWKAIHNSSEGCTRPERVRELLEIWASPFTAVSLIVNRETPLHKDRLGGQYYLDAVSTFGNYVNGRFEIPALGMRFRYNPGCVIFLNSYTFAHGASRVEGERYCIASFFRPNMIKNGSSYHPGAESMPAIQDYRRFYVENFGKGKSRVEEEEEE